LTRPKDGLFPKPAEIEIKCSCPDWAYLCKHAAAVLYGVGARLDAAPEMLFTLRNVDHPELVTHAVAAESLERTLSAGAPGLADADLGEVFGIELDVGQSGGAGCTQQAGPAPVAAETPSKGAKRGRVRVEPVQVRRARSQAVSQLPRGSKSGKRKSKKAMAVSS
jgi:hypothetical protein